MKLLLVPASYPHPGAPWIGAFNEHSALALRMIVERVEVLVPRPYAPRVLANAGRWRSHALTPARQRQGDITVHRPAYPVLPWVLPSSAWTRTVFSRPCARRLHRAIGFDAILSFDLAAQAGSVLALLKKYADRDMDLADACIVRMTELTKACTVLTVDRGDFAVYRRNGRDVIPILAPPAG